MKQHRHGKALVMLAALLLAGCPAVGSAVQDKTALAAENAEEPEFQGHSYRLRDLTPGEVLLLTVQGSAGTSATRAIRM